MKSVGVVTGNPALPTRSEYIADMAVHGGGLMAALVGTPVLLLFASRGGHAAVTACGVYAAGLLIMLGCSTAYNWPRSSGAPAEWVGRSDQAAIFLMIAGSYTPFTALHLSGAWSIGLTVLIWALAAAGIALRLGAPRLFRRASLFLYLGLGWVGLIAMSPLHHALSGPVLAMLFAGGLLYTAGVPFHVSRRFPFQNAIWHAFVVAGAGIHFAAIVVSLRAGPLNAGF